MNGVLEQTLNKLISGIKNLMKNYMKLRKKEGN